MNSRTFRSVSARSWLRGIFSLLLAAAPTALLAQTDDFNDGNDNGWAHYDPLGGLGGPPGSFTFPGGNTYRLSGAARPAALQQAGQERLASYRANVNYTNFFISVDVVNWNNSVDQAIGILARIGTPGLGQTIGYAFTMQVQDTDISISRLTGEAPTDLTGSSKTFVPNPSKDYRLVFIGKGSELTGRIYELPNLDTPVITTTGIDSTYTSGVAGLVVADLTSTSSAVGGPVDATFDNYAATDVEPPKLTYEYNASFNEFALRYSLDYSDWTLQSTTSLTPPIQWTDLASEVVGGQYYYIEPMDTGNKFFRLKRP